MAIEPVNNVPQAPRVIRHEDSALPKKKKEKQKDGEKPEKQEKGKIDITV